MEHYGKTVSLDSWLSVRAQSPSPSSLIQISWFLWQSSRELLVHGSRCPQLLTGLMCSARLEHRIYRQGWPQTSS